MTAKFEIYKGKIGDFYWRLIHANGHIIAKPDEVYTTKINAIHGLNSVKKNVPSATVEDRTGYRIVNTRENHNVKRGLL